jgi:RNA polymerase sigma-70 factor (ECF subfamily)
MAPADPAAHDAALRELTDLHGSVLLTFLLRLTRGDPHKAEDILQETLIRAWRHPEARGPDGAWSRPWLFTLARRIAIDHARASQTRPPELSDDRLQERVPADDGIERLIDAGEVRAALRSLPDRLRHVLVEMYFRERSVAEAAAVLAVPSGTVKSRTFYALAALRDALFTDRTGEDAGGALPRGDTGDGTVREPGGTPDR